jgi:hypothetical protein
MIVNGWKMVENRDWPTLFRGRFLVHASKGMTHDEYDEAAQLAYDIRDDVEELPLFEEIERGGIVGSVELVDCIEKGTAESLENADAWFFGRYGFMLRAPEVLPFRPFPGRLGFFDVPVL